jgi:hypothetical protein
VPCRAFASGWLETAVCLPSKIGYGCKFFNGLASRLEEAWGGPTRESVMLQLLANSPETASCFSDPLEVSAAWSRGLGEVSP